ncbi:glycosyltransferase [Aquisalimonas lutea]|uniref:glycosyltransferase n=1 Tax=Aquisalimonas lutea TaxID=1327750 RepID=UPI0025B2B5D1|nr:glycosyltransferase [Aquisalimonas lutea]MDN3517828.1 glycosyltransferase [Aquisalimonas lutea]
MHMPRKVSDKRLLLVSLYYRNDVVTGANKRFAELAAELASRWPGPVEAIVPEGHRLTATVCPDGCGVRAECSELKGAARGGVLGRIREWLTLSVMLARRSPSVVISDFMPVPFMGLRQHCHYQLVHDVRSATGFGRWRFGDIVRRWQAWQWRRCQRLIAVSDFTRNMLVSECGVAASRVTVSYNGVRRAFVEAPRCRRQETDFLYIATFEPRKNHLKLVEAFARLQRRLERRLTMRLVGRDLGTRDEVEYAIQAAGMQSDIGILESVGDESALMAHYDSSRVFVSPSVFEGFGMPLIEARARDCTVCCSRISVFQEIMADQAVFFDPLNAVDMATAMERALADACEDRQGSGWVAMHYTWPAIAERLTRNLLKANDD